LSGLAKARAFGKLILLGEHVVVYGAPALVAGIGLGVEAEASAGGDGQQLELLGRTRAADPSGDDLSRAFAALLADGGAPKALHVRASGNLPPGMGLGFSAAAGVAIARAVEGLNGDVDESRVRSRATAWETVFHGNPSGVDVAAAMRGGCTRFTKADGVSKVLVKEPLLLCVGLTGSGASTREMVEGVADLKRRKPELVERSIDGGAALVENAISAVEAGDHRALGELMNLNQMILAGLMVSNEKIETLVACARVSGALGAKLTGAGGGGAVVALAEDQSAADAIVAAWREIGYEGFCTEVGHP
jgi:mevalonate kinase